MPTSATGTFPPDLRRGGFTLLEVMVVLVLVAIIASLATLGVRTPGERERIADEARRLAASIGLARQEALLLGELRGVRFEEDGYHLVAADDDGLWSAPERGGATLPEGMRLRLEVEGRAVSLDVQDTAPQVLLLPGGEATAFAVEISTGRDPGFLVTMDLLGRLETREYR